MAEGKKSKFPFLKGETAEIGEGCEIQHGAVIENDVKIGRNCFIGYSAIVQAGTIVEDCVFIGARALLLNTRRISHYREYDSETRGAHVEYGARIAPGAILMPGVRVGREALIGAGAIVSRDVPRREIHFGVPAAKRGLVPESEFLKDPNKK